MARLLYHAPNSCPLLKILVSRIETVHLNHKGYNSVGCCSANAHCRDLDVVSVTTILAIISRRSSPSVVTSWSRVPNNNRRRRRNARSMGPSTSRAMMMMMSFRLFFVVIPLLPLLRRCAKIEARANDPEKEKKTSDGTDDNACDCAAA